MIAGRPRAIIAFLLAVVGPLSAESAAETPPAQPAVAAAPAVLAADGGSATPVPTNASERATSAEAIVDSHPGDPDLMILARPGAALGSFRYVVRSGGSSDPAGMAGLAHLLEHLVMHGSVEVGGESFASAVRRKGGSYNAHTRELSTIFEVDAPSEALLPLAGQLIRIVSSPALWRVPLVQERGVVETEAIFHGPDPLFEIIDSSVFPQAGRHQQVIGTQSTLRGIALPDLITFYNKEYVASNSALVFVGDFSPAAVRAVVEESFRMPPSLPSEKTHPVTPRAPDVPVRETVKSSIPALILGYSLAEPDFAQCPNLADLLDLRLLPVHTRFGVSSKIEASCVRLRQAPFLLVAAVDMVEGARAFQDPLRAVIETMSEKPATAEERKLVASRQRERRIALEREPRAIAELLASLVTMDGLSASDAMNRFLHPPEWSSSEVVDLAKRLFVAEGSITLQLK